MLNLFNVSSTNEHILYLLVDKSHIFRYEYNEIKLFTQQIVLTNGATYTLRTTSPKPRIKLIKDTRNHPLWNPSQLSQALDDDSGQLSKFIKKFGDEEYDLEFMESDENLPDLTRTNELVLFTCSDLQHFSRRGINNVHKSARALRKRTTSTRRYYFYSNFLPIKR
ncbi:unnamed protein product [Rhizophagus irregularis]|nr:unnamed protein product [Rhizophagus irregularis]